MEADKVLVIKGVLVKASGPDQAARVCFIVPECLILEQIEMQACRAVNVYPELDVENEHLHERFVVRTRWHHLNNF